MKKFVKFCTISTIIECVPISAFASLFESRIEITSSAIGLKMCVISAGII